MDKKNKLTGIAVSIAIASAITSGACIAAQNESAQSATVKCSGINSCKGASECATANSSCKGQNSCQGQGWVTKNSEKECVDAGGKVLTDNN